jgi:hypothetical protein
MRLSHFYVFVFSSLLLTAQVDRTAITGPEHFVPHILRRMQAGKAREAQGGHKIGHSGRLKLGSEVA